MIRKILMARKIRQPVCKQDSVLETGSWLSLKVAQPNALGVGMGREGQTGDQNPGLWELLEGRECISGISPQDLAQRRPLRKCQ